jgi:hypothetical protein
MSPENVFGTAVIFMAVPFHVADTVPGSPLDAKIPTTRLAPAPTVCEAVTVVAPPLAVLAAVLFASKVTAIQI